MAVGYYLNLKIGERGCIIYFSRQRGIHQWRHGRQKLKIWLSIMRVCNFNDCRAQREQKLSLAFSQHKVSGQTYSLLTVKWRLCETVQWAAMRLRQYGNPLKTFWNVWVTVTLFSLNTSIVNSLNESFLFVENMWTIYNTNWCCFVLHTVTDCCSFYRSSLTENISGLEMSGCLETENWSCWEVRITKLMMNLLDH